MATFDDLTLGEVEEMSTVALGGKSVSDSDPLMLSGGTMWIIQRRDNPSLQWEDFKKSVTMKQIKDFSLEMQAQDLMDPTIDRNVPAI